MFFDTDVLIWVSRGNEKATREVEAQADRGISIVTYMELLQGAKRRDEIHLIKGFLVELGFATLPVTEAIGHRAAIYIEEYGLKSGLLVADALIAATAVENHQTLCTGNRKHFAAIADLEIKQFRA